MYLGATLVFGQMQFASHRARLPCLERQIEKEKGELTVAEAPRLLLFLPPLLVSVAGSLFANCTLAEGMEKQLETKGER